MNLRVNFWVNKSGNLNSHHTGLSQEQVDSLKSLKVGDRLVVWQENKRRKETDPHYVLKRDMPVESKVPALKATAVVSEATTTPDTSPPVDLPKKSTFRRTEESKFE